MDFLRGLAADPVFSSRYELGPLLGEGGMGAVFSAVQRDLKRPVAVKVLRTGTVFSEDDVARFQREARLSARLSHPNIVIVFDYGVAGGVPYLVTELLDGQSLARLLSDRGSLTVPEVLPIARGILSGLTAMHRAGIVHRDLKPHNIQILPGQPPCAKILDFGIATALAHTTVALTEAGRVMGTPEFMAPEQLRGEGATEPTDLYAFSLVLAEMIQGVSPIPTSNPLERVRAEPSFSKGLAWGIRSLLIRGLAPAPEDRFPSARAYLDALDQLAPDLERTGSFFETGLEPATPTVALVRPPPALRRAGLWWAVLAGVVVGAVLPVDAPKPVSGVSFRKQAPQPLPAAEGKPLPDDTVFGRWRLVQAKREILEAGGPTAVKALEDLRVRTGLDLGTSAKSWLFWVDLGEWLAAPGKHARPGSPAIEMDEIDSRIFNGGTGGIPLTASERLLPMLIRQLSVTPGSGLLWLSFAWVLDREGQTDAALVAYRAGLSLLRTLPDRIGSRLFWMALVRASLKLRPEWLEGIARIAPDEFDSGLRELVDLGTAGLKSNHVENFLLSMVRLYPGSQNMDLALGHYWRACGRHREAAGLWLKAERRQHRENLFPELRSLAWHFLDRGDLDELVQFRNVLSGDPELQVTMDLLIAADKGEPLDAALPASMAENQQLLRIQTFCLVERGRLEAATKLVAAVRTRVIRRTSSSELDLQASSPVDLSLDLLGAGVANDAITTDIRFLLTPAHSTDTWEKAADTLSNPAGAYWFRFLAQEGLRFRLKSQQLLVRALWASRLDRHEEALKSLLEATGSMRIPGMGWSVPCEILMRAHFAGSRTVELNVCPWPPEGSKERLLLESLARGDLAGMERLAHELYDDDRVPWWGLLYLRAALAREDSSVVQQTVRELRTLVRRRARGYWVLREIDGLLVKPGVVSR